MKIKYLSTVGLWVFGSLLGYAITTSQAVTNPSEKDLSKVSQKVMPSSRKPAGTRGACNTTDQDAVYMTPVLPVSEQQKSPFFGKTVSPYPTFWFYVPQQATQVNGGEFSLEEESDSKAGGELIWRTHFKLPNTPGIVKLTMPDTGQALENNKRYRWYFKLNCSNEKSSGFIFHTGLIEKVDPNQLAAIGAKTSLDFYLDNELWYDAVAPLKQIRQSSSEWTNVLTAVGLLDWLEDENISGEVISTQD